MKGLLITLAFVAGPALACPADGSKEAERATDKTVAASSTPKPVAQTQAATKQKTVSTKVAVKSAREAKAAPL